MAFLSGSNTKNDIIKEISIDLIQDEPLIINDSIDCESIEERSSKFDLKSDANFASGNSFQNFDGINLDQNYYNKDEMLNTMHDRSENRSAEDIFNNVKNNL